LNNQQIRSFIAVELPEELKSGLIKLQKHLRSAEYSFIKWVAIEGIHLTLKFLGNIAADKVTDITGAVVKASQGISPFRLETGELGAFPNLRHPRVILIHIGGEMDTLLKLQRSIDDELVLLGFAKEKRNFTPHLTLARIREKASPQNCREFGELVANKSINSKYEFGVDSISLMKSQLLPGGAVYSRLADIKLVGLNK